MLIPSVLPYRKHIASILFLLVFLSFSLHSAHAKEELPLAHWKGVYETETGYWGSYFSPVIIDSNGQVSIAGTVVNVLFDEYHEKLILPATAIKGTEARGNITFYIDNNGTPSFSGILHPRPQDGPVGFRGIAQAPEDSFFGDVWPLPDKKPEGQRYCGDFEGVNWPAVGHFELTPRGFTINAYTEVSPGVLHAGSYQWGGERCGGYCIKRDNKVACRMSNERYDRNSIVMFSNRNFTGTPTELAVGNYGLTYKPWHVLETIFYNEKPLPVDKVGAIHIPRGYEVKICKGEHASAQCKVFKRSQADIHSQLGDGPLSFIGVMNDNNYLRAVKLGLLMGYRCEGTPGARHIDERGKELATNSTTCPIATVFEQRISIRSLREHEQFSFWDFINPFGHAKIVYNAPQCLKEDGTLALCFNEDGTENLNTIVHRPLQDITNNERMFVHVTKKIGVVKRGFYYRLYPEDKKVDKNTKLAMVPVDNDRCIAQNNCRKIKDSDKIKSFGPAISDTSSGKKLHYLVNRCALRPDMAKIDQQSLAQIMRLSRADVSATDEYFRLSCSYNPAYLKNIESLRGDNSAGAFWGELGLSLTHAIEAIGAVAVAAVTFQPEIVGAWEAFSAFVGEGVAGGIATTGEATMVGLTIAQTINDIVGIAKCAPEDAGCRGQHTGQLMVDLWMLKNTRNPFAAEEIEGYSGMAARAESVIDDITTELEVAKQFEFYQDYEFSDAALAKVEALTADGEMGAKEVNELSQLLYKERINASFCPR